MGIKRNASIYTSKDKKKKKRLNILTSVYNNQCRYLERTRIRPSWDVFSVLTSLITSSRTLLSAVDCLSIHVGHSRTVILKSLFSWLQKYVVLKIYYIFLSMAWWKWRANDLLYFCINISLEFNKYNTVKHQSVNEKCRNKTLDCRISLVIVTLDPFASDTCLTVISPTNLTWVLVGNQAEDCRKQNVVCKW